MTSGSLYMLNYINLLTSNPLFHKTRWSILNEVLNACQRASSTTAKQCLQCILHIRALKAHWYDGWCVFYQIRSQPTTEIIRPWWIWIPCSSRSSSTLPAFAIANGVVRTGKELQTKAYKVRKQLWVICFINTLWLLKTQHLIRLSFYSSNTLTWTDTDNRGKL